ncbi:unnamed protein product [Effrenium voratum]|nr:unnamed protein product [Effrenium voratum]
MATAEATATAEEDGEDLQTLLQELVERNRHVSGMALVRHEGGEAEETQEAVAVGLEHPSQEAVAALNAAFYEGEEAGPISLAGRRMLPAQRLEIGDFLVVRLAEGELGASSEAKSVLRGDDLSGLLRASCGSDSAQVTEEAAAALQGPLVAPMPGAWLCATRKYVLVTAFDAGMDTSFALKVCIGVVEHLLSEGH